MYDFDMNLLTTLFPTLQTVSAMCSGLLAGALLAEACVLVPYWRKMTPDDFLELHHTMAPSLFRFFAPITVAGTVIPLLTLSAALLVGSPTTPWWAVSAVAGVSMLVIYFGYFKHANEKFETGTIHNNELRAELSKWASWHNLRTIISVLGTLSALLAIQQ